MNRDSKLTGDDYLDFLLAAYFGEHLGTRDQWLKACIERAYRDFCRTLHGISKINRGDQEALRDTAKTQAAKMILDHLEKLQLLTTPEEFDKGHECLSDSLIIVYNNHGFSLKAGQSQKWINMTMKYIFVLGKRIGGFDAIYTCCHMPLDNRVLKKLRTHVIAGLPSPDSWSKIDYKAYRAAQKRIRQHFKPFALLDVEHWLWLGKGVPEHFCTTHISLSIGWSTTATRFSSNRVSV